MDHEAACTAQGRTLAVRETASTILHEIPGRPSKIDLASVLPRKPARVRAG